MIRIRVYETKTLVLVADFDSEFVPRVGEHLILGPHLNEGDINLSKHTTHEVLNVVYQAPWCVHVVVGLGVDGFYLGNVVDGSILDAFHEIGRRRVVHDEDDDTS